MLHFLKQALVLAPQAIVLSLDALQLHRGMGQLALGVAAGLDRRFQVLDVVRG